MAFFRNEIAKQPHFRKLAPKAFAVRRYVLRGRIVTMNSAHDIIHDGFICIENDTIAHLGNWNGILPVPFDSAPLVPVNGSVYPGLVELHNHPAYNVVPMWPVVQHFEHRNIWRADAGYKRWVSNTDKLLCYHPVENYPKALVRFVECRALLGGVTTTQGLQYKNGAPLTSYFEGLVRNVEFPVKNWPVAEDYIFDLPTKQAAEAQLGPPIAARKPYIIHLAEGVDAGTRALFDNLQKADGSWLLASTLVTIHATALEKVEFDIMGQNHHGGIVWSPLSNLLLYGATTKVALAKQAGLPIAIGSDWAPSGTKNLLGELKFAKRVSEHEGGIFSDQELVDSVTRVPAAMLGWDPYVGSIEINKTADLLVVDSASNDPYRDLINADESKIIAVIIDGRPRAGRATIIDPGSTGVELIHIAQQNLVLDIIDSSTHPLGGTSLSGAITTMTQALANLPNVAREAHMLVPLMKDVVEQWRPIPDYEDGPEVRLFAAADLPGPDDVDSMTIEPMTAIDDSEFLGRIKSNPNIPKWLKDEL
jgi:5-methylthioadenosine/S-adenosylhomocysteine deaminase